MSYKKYMGEYVVITSEDELWPTKPPEWGTIDPTCRMMQWTHDESVRNAKNSPIFDKALKTLSKESLSASH